MLSFELHQNLQPKAFILDLPLSRVLLEDEKNYPWLFLVPRRKEVRCLMDLTERDQVDLMREVYWAQKVLWNLFSLTQLNVAAIGNKTPQLHVHVIGRREDDPAWPCTVWDHPIRAPYAPEEKSWKIKQIRQEFELVYPLSK